MKHVVLLLLFVIVGNAFHSPFQQIPSMKRHKIDADERKLKLAMYQGPVTNGDVQANLKLITAKNGSDIVMFPEVTLSGYANFTMDEIYSMAEVRHGTAFQYLAKIAKQLNINILYGYIESDPFNQTILYDSAQLISSNGDSLLNHRKVQLSGGEKDVFTPGQSFGPIVEINGIKIGVLICYEVSLPEPSRILALQQAEVILIPTAQASPPDLNIYAKYQVPTRASENLVFVAYCNYAQPGDWVSFWGMSHAVDPYGATLAWGPTGIENATALLFVDIYPDRYYPPCTLLSDRLPPKYTMICERDAYCLTE